MDFTQRLACNAAKVEQRLAALLEDGKHGSPPVPERLHAAMRHAVLGGGKRFRPFLVIESAVLFQIPAEDALNTAAALELIHCYSLVHDDLPSMDDDDLRRGLPTIHKAFDEWTAILTGDALLTLAFEVLARPETHADPAVRAELLLALARAAGASGMVGGQVLDLEADKLGRALATKDEIQAMQGMKTGALIRFAAESGAILAGAKQAEREALSSYGTALGFAFQVADDLLDAEGETATVGKTTAKDSRKATLISLIGIDEARRRLADIEAHAIDALAPFGNKADALREAARFVSRRNS
jgi:farnesyl diphosphate synthase